MSTSKDSDEVRETRRSMFRDANKGVLLHLEQPKKVDSTGSKVAGGTITSAPLVTKFEFKSANIIDEAFRRFLNGIKT